jgi:hypothetical protein
MKPALLLTALLAQPSDIKEMFLIILQGDVSTSQHEEVQVVKSKNKAEKVFQLFADEGMTPVPKNLGRPKGSVKNASRTNALREAINARINASATKSIVMGVHWDEIAEELGVPVTGAFKQCAYNLKDFKRQNGFWLKAG